MNRTSQIWDSFNFGENGCLIIYLCIIFQHAVKDSIPNKVDGRVSNTCNCMVNWIIGWQRKNAFMVYNWFADILSVYWVWCWSMEQWNGDVQSIR